MPAFWQQIEKFTVAGGGGTATFILKPNAPIERLTVWGNSGARLIGNVSMQFLVNNRPYNPPVNVVGRVLGDVVYRSGGAFAEDDIMPCPPPGRVPADFDPFVMSVLLTNAAADPIEVTMMAVGLHHTGG